MSTRSVEHGSFTLTRTYPVPPERVFAAWSSQESKARWFGAPGYELDFRVGGHEVNRGGPPGGPVYTFDAQFRDIVPNQRIVSTYEMSADDVRISVSVATVEFRAVDTGTVLVLTEQGVFLDGHDTAAQREEGTRSMLNSLANALDSDA